MSEKRKAAAKIVAVVCGKKYTLELFDVRLWPKRRRGCAVVGGQWRVRVNGKWAGGKLAGVERAGKIDIWTVSAVFAQLRRLVVRRLKARSSAR